VFNKADRLDQPPDDDELAASCEGHPWALLSTRDAGAVARLESTLIQAVQSQEEALTAFVPYSAASTLSMIYANCRVAGSDASDAGLTLRIQGPKSVMSRIKHSLGKVS
jgi:50S ribosomal subunit-associated GTPase HflX